MAKKSDSQRTFSVAVVGLSGTEKEKGSAGVGKSCLCNRFTRPLADEYYVDHISVLSQSDFSGRVVNNDHFLYWGEVTKTSDEGTDFHFAVIEQTEFIDDSSFQPFKSGKTEPYMKRCSATKIQSAEKLMYICKNQLGIEKEYEQKVIPEGRMNVDGFVCVLDVSVIPNRSVERQAEYVVAILNNLMKTKKPIVLATSKNDEAHEHYVKEAEKLVNRKEFKGSIPIVETSAHENVNVELAFIVLAQMIDRTKGRSKITPFAEAARARREVLDVATEAYQSLIRSQVNDYRSLWNSYSKKFAQNQDFVHFCELFGHDQAQKEFRRHIKKLKEEFILQKKQTYLEDLPEVLQDLLPDINSIDSRDWTAVQQHLKEHGSFNDYFVETPDDLPWQESDLVDSTDSRIPFDLLESSEAELCFRNHVNTLQADQKRLDMRQQFKNLLEETGYVTPGKCLSEVHVLLIGRECYEALSEVDRQDIYDVHQKEIIDRARQNFQEVLLEHADCFYRFTSIGPSGAITQEDINKITDVLQEDSRYKALDRLDQDRKLMLFRHLGFVHCPIREHCPAFPNCMDCLIERVVATKAHRPASWSRNSQWQMNTDNNQLNLVILGSDGLADELATEIRAQCEDDEYEMDNVLYSLDYRIIDGDVNLPQNSFRTSDFLPHGITQQPEPLRGCFCVYSSTKTLEYVRESLEKTLLSNLEQEDRLPFQGLPIVILFAADPATNEKELLLLREDGQTLADNLQCPFIDITGEELPASQQFNEIQLRQALRSLLESIQHRAGFLNIYHSLPEAAEPDIRIIMCMFCGDPYSVEHVLGPLLNHQCCFTSGERSIILETFLGDSKRRVEVIVSSYHGANAFREDLVHGFILVFSTKRKASLATLRAETRRRKAHQSARARKIAFSMNIPNLPIQILAVTESGGANAFFSSDLSHTLITEGNAIADRLQAHFMTATPTCQQKTAFYTPFFKEVWEKKPEIEQAFNMEEPVPAIGTGTLPSRDTTVDRRTLPMHQVPPPPPHRRESYHIRPSSADGSADSESHYERLPTDGSQGDELDEPVSPSFIEDRPLSPSDDSDLYSNVYSQENGEHLIKPSQIKNRRSMHGDLYPESYASTESLSQKQTSSIPSDVELSYPSLPPFPGTPSPPYCFPGSPRPSHHGTGPPGLSTYRSLQRRSTGGKPVPLPRYQFKKTSSMRLASITRRDDDSDPGLPSRGHDRGFKVYPPPETPPEPAPPDTPPRRLKKATTLPSGSRTSLDDDDHGSRESLPQDPGWVDDSIFLRDHRDDDWVDHDHFHSYTMGRRKVPPPTKPKPGGKSKPGKLDLKNFTNVGNAIARLNLGAKEQGAPKLTKVGLHAPLATPESVELGPEYAQVKDAVPLFSNDSEYAYAIVQDALPANKMHRMRTQRREEKALTDSDSEWSSLERRQRDMYTKVSRKPTPHKKVRKKRSIPVAPPRVPPLPYEGLSSHLATYASERMLAAHSLDPLDKGKVVSHYRRGYYKTTWEPAEALPFRSGSPSEGSDDGTDGDVVEHYKAARPKYKPKRSFKLKKKPHASYLGNTLQHQFSSQLTSDSDLFSPSLKKLEQSAFQSQQDDDSSFEVSSPKDPNSPILFGAVTKTRGEGEKTATRRKDKKSKEDEKLEKRRQKEEEKQKRLAEKEKERQEKEKKKQKKVGTLKSATSTQQAVQILEDFAQSDDNPIPLFLEKCIMSIEEEGLDSEGIYRVPGNRAHVDLLFQKFDEDQNISIRELDIPVNAIATALKDFFSKRLPHLLPQEVTTELIEVAKISDRSCRLLALRSLLKKLPVSNFEILKFVFQHFVRVAENCKLNSMDSKNLAICWWPTLLPIQFTDMGEFEQMRPLLEDSVQTMIDQFRFLFCGQEEVVMV